MEITKRHFFGLFVSSAPPLFLPASPSTKTSDATCTAQCPATPLAKRRITYFSCQHNIERACATRPDSSLRSCIKPLAKLLPMYSAWWTSMGNCSSVGVWQSTARCDARNGRSLSARVSGVRFPRPSRSGSSASLQNKRAACGADLNMSVSSIHETLARNIMAATPQLLISSYQRMRTTSTLPAQSRL